MECWTLETHRRNGKSVRRRVLTLRNYFFIPRVRSGVISDILIFVSQFDLEVSAVLIFSQFDLETFPLDLEFN